MGMTDAKICEVLDRYEVRLAELKKQCDPETHSPQFFESLAHLGGMIPKVRVFLEEGRREKAFRWLGFMQGVFYSLRVYTIEEMANHNRPD